MREPPVALVDLVKKHERKIRTWESGQLREIFRYRGWFRIDRWDGERIDSVSSDPKHSADNPDHRKGSGIMFVGDEASISLTPRARASLDRRSKGSGVPEKPKYVNRRRLTPELQKIKSRQVRKTETN